MSSAREEIFSKLKKATKQFDLPEKPGEKYPTFPGSQRGKSMAKPEYLVRRMSYLRN